MIDIKKIDDIKDINYLFTDYESSLPQDISQSVKKIISDVKNLGDEAIIYYTKVFDNICGEYSIKVEQKEIEKAYLSVNNEFIQSIQLAIQNITEFHKNQIQSTWTITNKNGSKLGNIITPIESAAIYVPGGKACYPSSLIMNYIPALLAGVENIILLTPPQIDGSINKYLGAAAYLLGVKNIYKVGGAQAIAAVAYGTKTIPKVHKIVGPGNAYVAYAKKEVYGIVDIDMIAGPSEIMIIADKTINPRYIAADLLSQAEHDEMARCILITDSKDIANLIQDEVKRQYQGLQRKEIIKASLKNNSKIIIVNNLSDSVEIVNSFAPEHLQINTDDPYLLLKDIKNAGAIFMGEYSTEPIGDYIIGPNHVLPTNGTAKYFSPLGVYDFQKRTSFIHCSKKDFDEISNAAINIAEVEGLTAHSNAMKVRIKNGNNIDNKA